MRQATFACENCRVVSLKTARRRGTEEGKEPRKEQGGKDQNGTERGAGTEGRTGPRREENRQVEEQCQKRETTTERQNGTQRGAETEKRT
jgi:hypothetical protein